MQYQVFSLMCLAVAAIDPTTLSLDAYTKQQSRAALSGILANSAQYPGVIAASLARDTARAGESGGQNYYYQWTRDAALTMKSIINQFASGDTALEPFIRAYIENEATLQRLDTLSGNFTTGGLAEPKYYMNSTAFNEPWGRPQPDGPALRAITIMGYLSLVNDTRYVRNVTQRVVLPDLNYVASNWNASGFDLWEEQNGTHFFTAMVQSRALQDGAVFLNSTNSTTSSYLLQQDDSLGAYIDTFWNASGLTFNAQHNMTKPTGSDCANLLASLHGSKRYSPSSEKILASAATLIDEMTGLYNITAALNSTSNNTAIPIGRYPSDVYDGIQTSQGNPWFLCNSAVAELLYLAAGEITNKSINVTTLNYPLLRKVSPDIQINQTITNQSSLIAAMRRYADGFLAIEQQFVGSNFSMSEQINRTTGAQQGAHDLTWSYAAFLSAARARANQSTYEFYKGYPENALINASNVTYFNTTRIRTYSAEREQKSSSMRLRLSVLGLLSILMIM